MVEIIVNIEMDAMLRRGHTFPLQKIIERMECGSLRVVTGDPRCDGATINSRIISKNEFKKERPCWLRSLPLMEETYQQRDRRVREFEDELLIPAYQRALIG